MDARSPHGVRRASPFQRACARDLRRPRSAAPFAQPDGELALPAGRPPPHFEFVPSSAAASGPYGLSRPSSSERMARRLEREQARVVGSDRAPVRIIAPLACPEDRPHRRPRAAPPPGAPLDAAAARVPGAPRAGSTGGEPPRRGPPPSRTPRTSARDRFATVAEAPRRPRERLRPGLGGLHAAARDPSAPRPRPR